MSERDLVRRTLGVLQSILGTEEVKTDTTRPVCR